MRSAYLDDAEPEAISHAVREVLEKRGALVNEHRHSRVRFTGVRPHPMSWARAGYVGIYQAVGEREAEVRLILRAQWPWRILWAVCIFNLLALLLAILTQASGTVWSSLAILCGLLLIAASIVYVGTLKAVREEERSLMADFEAALERLVNAEVLTDEERELKELEAELEGEITRRALVKNRPPREKGKRFTLRPAKKGAAADEGPDEADETPEARRARLLARKAELEARRAERDAQAPKGPEP